MINSITKLEVKVTKVIDGDTFVSDDITFAFLNFRFDVVQPHFRLLGVDTPERGKKGYKEATAFTSEKLLGKTVSIDVTGLDAFNRVLCTVYLVGEDTLNEQLLANKLAKVYKPKK